MPYACPTRPLRALHANLMRALREPYACPSRALRIPPRALRVLYACSMRALRMRYAGPTRALRVPCACPTHTLGEVPHAFRARALCLPLRVPYAFLVLPCRPLVPLGPDWRSLHLLERFRVPCACPVHVLRTRALRVPDVCPMRAARVPYAGPAHAPRVPYACPTHAPLRVA